MNWSFKKINSEDANIIEDIINNFTKRDDVEKLISPKTDEYFLIDKRNEINILIAYDKIVIANHKYNISKYMGLSFNDKMKSIIRDKIEEERQALKNMLFNNELELLNNIKNIE